MSDDKFQQKFLSQQAKSKKELPYPKEWLLSEQEKDKLHKEAEQAINLFVKAYSNDQ